MRVPYRHIALFGALALSASPAAARSGDGAQQMDQTISDVDPLATSLRLVDYEVDLRQDAEFERVYAVPGQPGQLMRRQGGLVAVFDRSHYVPTWYGPVPVIPPNTVFYVGGIPEDLEEVHAPGRIDTRIQGRLIPAAGGLRADEAPQSAIVPRPDVKPGRADMADERYRVRRLEEITTRAVQRLRG